MAPQMCRPASQRPSAPALPPRGMSTRLTGAWGSSAIRRARHVTPPIGLSSNRCMGLIRSPIHPGSARPPPRIQAHGVDPPLRVRQPRKRERRGSRTDADERRCRVLVAAAGPPAPTGARGSSQFRRACELASPIGSSSNRCKGLSLSPRARGRVPPNQTSGPSRPDRQSPPASPAPAGPTCPRDRPRPSATPRQCVI